MRFTADLAIHIHHLLSTEVQGIGDPHSSNPLGVVLGWSRPKLIALNAVVEGAGWKGVRTAVYVVCDLQSIVRYVGSVRRTRPSVAARLNGHLNEPKPHHRHWAQVGLVRLSDELSIEAVLRCEGLIGRALDPLDNLRLPAVPERAAWRPRGHTA